MSKVVWQTDYSSSRAAGGAGWALSPEAAGALHRRISEALDGEQAEQLPTSRHSALLASATGRHSLRFKHQPPHGAGAMCYKIFLRKSSNIVRWESPLSAMQRAEGIVIRHMSGVDDVEAFRVPPPDVQAIIALAVRSALNNGTPLSPGKRLMSHVATSDVYVIAARDIIQYESHTKAIVAQWERASSGGDVWTIEEKLHKLASLQTLAMAASHKLEAGYALSDEEASVIEALAQGRKELEDDAERARIGASDDGNDSGTAQIMALSKIALGEMECGHGHGPAGGACDHHHQ